MPFVLGVGGSLGGLLNVISKAISFPYPQDLMNLMDAMHVPLVVPVLGFSGAGISYFMPRAGGPVLLAAVLASLLLLPDWPMLTFVSIAYFGGTVLLFIATLMVGVKADTWDKPKNQNL
jgi:hypothetical protein